MREGLSEVISNSCLSLSGKQVMMDQGPRASGEENDGPSMEPSRPKYHVRCCKANPTISKMPSQIWAFSPDRSTKRCQTGILVSNTLPPSPQRKSTLEASMVHHRQALMELTKVFGTRNKQESESPRDNPTNMWQIMAHPTKEMAGTRGGYDRFHKATTWDYRRSLRKSWALETDKYLVLRPTFVGVQRTITKSTTQEVCR